MAKIEKPEALKEIDRIIDISDAVMVARGDLGVEVAFHQVPMLQKRIVEKCIETATPVIIATQMMESMITALRGICILSARLHLLQRGWDSPADRSTRHYNLYPIRLHSCQDILTQTAGQHLRLHHEQGPLSLVWGVQAFFLESSGHIEEYVNRSMELLRKEGLVDPGDVLVHVGSIPLLEHGKTNMLKVSYLRNTAE